MGKLIAIRRGRSTGIFDSWDAAKPHVAGFSKAEYKGFKTREEAVAWLGDGFHVSQPENSVQVAPTAVANEAARCKDGYTGIEDAASKLIAIRCGRATGIFRSWAEAEPHIVGFSGAEYKGFKTKDEAEEWLTGIETLRTSVPANSSLPAPIPMSGEAMPLGIEVMLPVARAKDVTSASSSSKRSHAGEEDGALKRQRVNSGESVARMQIEPLPSGARIPAMGTLHIRGDSKLVVNQVNGVWRVHKEHLQDLCEANRKLCHDLLRQHQVKPPKGKGYFLSLIPRDCNGDADELANKAMDTRGCAQAWTVPVETASCQASSHYLLTFDGGARGNPGLAGCGAKLSLCDDAGNSKEKIWRGYEFIGENETNNVAEHCGLHLGLRVATIVAQHGGKLPSPSVERSIACQLGAITQPANGGS
jgi:ribonuclease HI